MLCEAAAVNIIAGKRHEKRPLYTIGAEDDTSMDKIPIK